VAAGAEVTLLTREGCHLCEEALTIVSSVCAAHDASWRTIDVDTDPELRAAYTDHVPVIFVNGALHGYWFVDADKLAAAVST